MFSTDNPQRYYRPSVTCISMTLDNAKFRSFYIEDVQLWGIKFKHDLLELPILSANGLILYRHIYIQSYAFYSNACSEYTI